MLSGFHTDLVFDFSLLKRRVTCQVSRFVLKFSAVNWSQKKSNKMNFPFYSVDPVHWVNYELLAILSYGRLVL